MRTSKQVPPNRQYSPMSEDGILRLDELDFVVGGLDRPMVLPRELERPAVRLSPLEPGEG